MFLKISHFSKELPSKFQWGSLPRVLNRREKIGLFCLVVVFLGSTLFLALSFYLSRTEVKPIEGGIFREGMVGQPRFINPVLASSDIDRDLLEIIFAGLMKYDREGKIVPDLALNYQILEGGTVYELMLKEAYWHDGKEVSAEDVVFTIELIQNPELKSPEMINWLGVKVEKISSRQVRFRLQNPYLPFLERLTLKILPSHIFREIPSENFSLAHYNLEPVGSGPFRFNAIKYTRLGEVESITLSRNEDYFNPPSFLRELTFFFFKNEEELITAAQKKSLEAFIGLGPSQPDLPRKSSFALNSFPSPRYFALFFNPQNSKVLATAEIRKALNYAIDKNEILQKIFSGYGEISSSPVLPELYGFAPASKIYSFDPEQAEALFKEAGYQKSSGKLVKVFNREIGKLTKNLRQGNRNKEVENLQSCLALFPEIYPEGTISGFFGAQTEKAVIAFQEKYRDQILEPWGFEKGTGIVAETTRQKLNQVCQEAQSQTLPLELQITTVSQPFLLETANLIKEQWGKLGIKGRVEVFEPGAEMREVIQKRDYEILLFGESLGGIPDLFAFWHSSRTKEPGLNLTGFENPKADELLKKARESKSFEEMQGHLEAFQEVFLEESPAILLYRPNYLYWVSQGVKGIGAGMIVTPSQRFAEIRDWYVKTGRVWK